MLAAPPEDVIILHLEGRFVIFAFPTVTFRIEDDS